MLMVTCKKCGNEFIWLDGYNEFCHCGEQWSPFGINKDENSTAQDDSELRAALMRITKMKRSPGKDLAEQMRYVAYRALHK